MHDFRVIVRVLLYMASRPSGHVYHTPSKESGGRCTSAELDCIIREKDPVEVDHSLQPSRAREEEEEEGGERRRPKERQVYIKQPRGRGRYTRACEIVGHAVVGRRGTTEQASRDRLVVARRGVPSIADSAN